MEIGIIFGLMLASALGLLLFPLIKGAQEKKTLLVILALVFTGVSLGAYFNIGRPDLITPVIPDRPSQEQREEIDKFIRTVEELEARLRQEPDNVEGWATLGAGYSSMGRFSDATMAYIRASKLDPENPDFHAAIGEAVTLAGEGKVTEDAKAAFEAALALDPGNAIAHFYLGDYDFDNGNIQAAYDRWRALYEGLPANTPWLNLLEQRLETAAIALGIAPPEAPSLGEVTDMTETEQDQLIEDMVARLAARLEENPEDMEGWFRLGQSYLVLGRQAEAADALYHLVEDQPDDPAALSFYLQARLFDFEQNDLAIPENVIADLKKLEALNPNDTTALYYLGVAALQAGDRVTARTTWDRLLVLFPPGSEEVLFIKEKLKQLDRGS
ncbi:MAG: tetratricopeptide repeat protein [Alphaproteobacteria bacterium]